ncbi:DUF3800 domain-containing protein [Hamadaea sp. NPDC051192]|uniref:DUF3800 domain-containing protein n=1 Tax=Hamadaea sp. NPDC051192 TaxID=3154940 RepID=UPI00341FF623
MLLSYVDESYTNGKAWYYMAAVLVPDRQAVSLTEALDQVVLSAAARFGVSSAAELHGHELFQANRDWEPLAKMIRARIGVYAAAFRAIEAHGVQIILRGVRAEDLKLRYSSPMDPHSIVLGHVLERINAHAAEQDEFALVIADEVDQAAKHRADVSSYKAGGTLGYRSSTLRSIVDTIHFAPSSASRLVQAADMVAFLYNRTQQVTKGDSRALKASAELWRIIQPKIIHQHCWLPVSRS